MFRPVLYLAMVFAVIPAVTVLSAGTAQAAESTSRTATAGPVDEDDDDGYRDDQVAGLNKSASKISFFKFEYQLQENLAAPPGTRSDTDLVEFGIGFAF